MLTVAMQSNAQRPVTKLGANYKIEAPKSKATSGKDTGITIMDEKTGKVYKIYIGKTGACYYYRTSTKGSEYPCYLGEEISREICTRLGVPYTSKKRK